MQLECRTYQCEMLLTTFIVTCCLLLGLPGGKGTGSGGRGCCHLHPPPGPDPPVSPSHWPALLECPALPPPAVSQMCFMALLAGDIQVSPE